MAESEIRRMTVHMGTWWLIGRRMNKESKSQSNDEIPSPHPASDAVSLS